LAAALTFLAPALFVPRIGLFLPLADPFELDAIVISPFGWF
jgi:hypothetical protein